MGKFIDPKKASSYALVHKSVEDPTYEDDGTAMELVHKETRQNKRQRGGRRDILDEKMNYYEYDMNNPDDTVQDEKLFDDQEEAAFDQDFIQQMMDPASDEEEEEEELGDYPQHDAPQRDVDKEFEALMKSEYKARDMELEEDDPRVEGLMPVDAVVPALQEFVAEQHDGHFLKKDQDKQLFVDRLQATGEEVFHEDKNGRFYTVIQSKKNIDMQQSFQDGMDAAKKETLARIKAAEELEDQMVAAGLKEEAPETKVEYVTIRADQVRKEDRFDCQTILTTMSTLENHPGVIAAEKGRIRINPKSGKIIKPNKLTAKALDALGETSGVDKVKEQQQEWEGPAVSDGGSDAPQLEAAEEGAAAGVRFAEDLDDAGSVEESMITVIDTTVKRDKHETAEEKRARKQAVKEQKQMMRRSKKECKVVYKAETIRQRVVVPQAKQQQVQMSLK
eukprot:TRINITY_DN929_c0_g7_i1.p2 TRINITY_DN929_c0_g7~~TRINITY_DN929_c0_g7_i1.p2  ORF type:complete len:474 (+),score=262.47 TRINITY_DN929_c0_g7_i1:79-1422(+)